MKGWLWVLAAVLVGWAIFVAQSPKFERAPPGSPEHEAWLEQLVRACVEESGASEIGCRNGINEKLDLNPGAGPKRKMSN